ncbi:MAG: hypothetical protein R8G34_07810 [Paracoccaceae bacterium]|nr:hypothetical protein [Paracoccaceae bacterium]
MRDSETANTSHEAQLRRALVDALEFCYCPTFLAFAYFLAFDDATQEIFAVLASNFLSARTVMELFDSLSMSEKIQFGANEYTNDPTTLKKLAEDASAYFHALYSVALLTLLPFFLYCALMIAL